MKPIRQQRKEAYRLVFVLMLVGLCSGIISVAFISCSNTTIPKTGQPEETPFECKCPGYIKKEIIELQYEQLIRPITVEAVGFQGMVLKDSIGTIFVITDDKALHEVLQYSYNVGDTIR